MSMKCIFDKTCREYGTSNCSTSCYPYREVYGADAGSGYCNAMILNQYDKDNQRTKKLLSSTDLKVVFAVND